MSAGDDPDDGDGVLKVIAGAAIGSLMRRLSLYRTIIIPAHAGPDGAEHPALLGALCTRCGTLLVLGTGLTAGRTDAVPGDPIPVVDQGGNTIDTWVSAAIGHDRDEHPHGPYPAGVDCPTCATPILRHNGADRCPRCDAPAPPAVPT